MGSSTIFLQLLRFVFDILLQNSSLLYSTDCLAYRVQSPTLSTEYSPLPRISLHSDAALLIPSPTIRVHLVPVALRGLDMSRMAESSAMPSVQSHRYAKYDCPPFLQPTQASDQWTTRLLTNRCIHSNVRLLKSPPQLLMSIVLATVATRRNPLHLKDKTDWFQQIIKLWQLWIFLPSFLFCPLWFKHCYGQHSP